MNRQIKESIDHWVHNHAWDILQFVSELVQIETENVPPVGYEKAGQLYLKERMEKLGLEIDWFTVDDVPGIREHPQFFATVDGTKREYADRPIVVGTLRGSGGGRSMLFTGHMDTVVRDPVPWTESGPFSGEIKDGKLYGRGAYDMKSGLACGFYALKAVQALGIPLRGDVIVESVVDEEYGGANGTLASRLRGHRADIAINPEPTNMDLCDSHLGWASFKFVADGAEGISFANERTVNPVYTIGAVIEAVQLYEEVYNAWVQRPEPYGSFHFPIYTMQMHAAGSHYSGAVGIPGSATLIVGITACEGVDFDGLVRHFREFVSSHVRKRGFDPGTLRLEHPIRFLPASSARGEAFLETARNVYRECGIESSVGGGAPFACDAFISNLYFNTPTVMLGPGGANAHARNEFVYCSDVLELTRRFAYLIAGWCS
jgi:acetylornithine deacetylase